MLTDLYDLIRKLDQKHEAHRQHVNQQLQTIIDNQEKLMATLTELKAAVARNTSVTHSAITLIQGLASKLDAVKNDPAAIDALIEELNNDSAELGAAVAANTEPNPPAEVPPQTEPGTTTGGDTTGG